MKKFRLFIGIEKLRFYIHRVTLSIEISIVLMSNVRVRELKQLDGKSAEESRYYDRIEKDKKKFSGINN